MRISKDELKRRREAVAAMLKAVREKQVLNSNKAKQ